MNHHSKARLETLRTALALLAFVGGAGTSTTSSALAQEPATNATTEQETGSAKAQPGATAPDQTESATIEETKEEPAPARPGWLTEQEQAFLDSTGGLRPIASYDDDNGLVTIKLKKPGLTPAQIFEIAIGPRYDYYKRTDLVETSFRGEMDGKDYLFTGTVAKKYWPFTLKVASVPVVTQYTVAYKDNGIQIVWNNVDVETSKRFLDLHEDRLEKSMKDAGVTDSLEEYKEDIFDDLGDTKTIWGRHEYYPETGYYIYQQKAIMQSAVANIIAGVAGEGDIKGAALKIGYQLLREPDMAGPANADGKEVVDMSGKKITAGR